MTCPDACVRAVAPLKSFHASYQMRVTLFMLVIIYTVHSQIITQGWFMPSSSIMLI